MSKRKTTQEFIVEASQIHNNFYTYTHTDYKDAITKVIITCPIHGDFEQRPNSHLQGIGCKQCGIEKAHKTTRKTFRDFCNEAALVHDYKYEYVEESYESVSKSLDILCPIHGAFTQLAMSHLTGRKCPECSKATQGWTWSAWENQGNISSNFDTYKLYIIECWNDSERFYKIGKTFLTVGKRFYNKERMPYQWKVVDTTEGDARTISQLELQTHAELRAYSYTPEICFEGNTECFSCYELP